MLYDKIRTILDKVYRDYVVGDKEISYTIRKDGIKEPAYHGINSKSPIGELIPQELYHEKFEPLNIISLCDKFPYLQEFFVKEGIFPYEEKYWETFKEFLCEVQMLHDTSLTNKDNLVYRLLLLKEKWQLKCILLNL